MTVLVVLLSIIALIFIMVGGFKDRQYKSLSIWATVTLALMFVGAISADFVPKEYFCVAECFSLFVTTGFNAMLGV